jgi:hypothetical protein
MREGPGTPEASESLGGYPDEHDGASYVGTTARVMPVYYDESTNERLTAEMREDSDKPTWSERHELGSEEGLSDVLNDFEWDELTDYAKSHLPGMNADDGDESDSY